MSEGLVQAGVDGDQTVQGGQGDKAADLGPVTASLTWQAKAVVEDGGQERSAK